MRLSDLMYTIIDEFNKYDVGQISEYEIKGNDYEIEDSVNIDFAMNIDVHNATIKVYYTDEFNIKFSIKSADLPTITLLFVFAKMRYYKSIIALQFYHLACRRIKYDTFMLLYFAYARNNTTAFESILNADLKNMYESSDFAKNTAIDKLFRYNDDTTIFDITEKNIDDLIEECSDEPAFVAVLLNYKNSHFKPKEEDMKL